MTFFGLPPLAPLARAAAALAADFTSPPRRPSAAASRVDVGHREGEDDD
jgi:hypothetical protein